jgi:hypothetical protein
MTLSKTRALGPRRAWPRPSSLDNDDQAHRQAGKESNTLVSEVGTRILCGSWRAQQERRLIIAFPEQREA